MHTLLQDLRYGLRVLLKKPGFTFIAVLTLALGIGATTAIFSVVNAVMLRPLPYRSPNRLAMLWADNPKRDLHEEVTSYLNFTDWRSQSRTFADMALFTGNSLVLSGVEEPERILGAFVSANLFSVLGVSPVLGRTFTPDEEARGEHIVVLSYGLWQRQFGGVPEVIGKSVVFDGDMTAWKHDARSVRIIGVMPRGFYFPNKETQLWEPATTYWRWQEESTERVSADALRWSVIGRLKPDATLRQARADLNDIGHRLAEAYPTADPDFAGFGVNVVPMLDQVTGKKLQLALWVLLCAVAFVLLIACVNVANLILARGAAREREFAIRVALGAGRSRLMRQVLTEGALLAICAGLVGLGLAAAGVSMLAAFVPPGIPRLDEVRLDTNVFLFTASLSLLSGLLFGLAPAWKISRSSPNVLLKEGGSSSSGGVRLRRARGALVIVECALAVVLLTGAGLLIRSLLHLLSVNPGFKPGGVLITRVALPKPDVSGAQRVFAQREATLNQVMERLSALPGVQSAGAIGNFLLRGEANETITIEGRPTTPGGQGNGQLASEGVSPGFFKMMGVPLLRGRFLSRDDATRGIVMMFNTPEQRQLAAEQPTHPLAEAAVINETFARRFFQGEDPIGKRFYEGEPQGKHFWYEIVGVVGDIHRQGLEQQTIPEYFVPLIAGVSGTADVMVRAGGDPLTLAAGVRQAIRSVEKNSMILRVTTVDSRMGEFSAQRRFQTWLLALFAGLALVLASTGIYGLMHYAVVQRTQEIGIRIALGARNSDVLNLVIGQGMRLALFGIALGWLAALWLTDAMTHLLFGVKANDAPTFAGVALVLTGVALAACWIPARRATKVDPMIALRCE